MTSSRSKSNSQLAVDEAYSIIQKKHPISRVLSCLDFGTFFAFSLAPISVSKNDQYLSGPYMTAVDKRTGKVFIYDILSNPSAYDKATPVKVNDIMSSKLRQWR